MDTVGERIVWVRGKRKMSRPELAAATKIPYPTLAGIENGDQDSTTKLHVIAKALNCNAGFLETGRGEWDTSKGSGTSMEAQIEGIRLAQTLMARALARSIPDAGRALADSLKAPARSHPYLEDLRVVLDAVLRPQSLHAPAPPAPESTGRKRP